ncbi:MAG TPA: hypothetical protein VGR61_00895, partial [Candidatus Dormibacteraeota bacterium]|nr:hypothetical protein [Candidatus Dormibacteraeota bacterium]
HAYACGLNSDGLLPPHNLTPATVRFRGAEAAHAARTTTLQLAYVAHAERFVRGIPHPPDLPTEAWINKPPATQEVRR